MQYCKSLQAGDTREGGEGRHPILSTPRTQWTKGYLVWMDLGDTVNVRKLPAQWMSTLRK